MGPRISSSRHDTSAGGDNERICGLVNYLSTPKIDVWWAYQTIADHLILGLRGLITCPELVRDK